MISLDRLQTWLNQADIKEKNSPLYQFLSQLALAARELQTLVNVNINGPSGPASAISNQQFLTWNNNLVVLPNSRQLLPGTGVTFDDTVFGERTIDIAGATGIDHVVLSDGGIPTPEPVNDGAGNFIYIPYTP